jgi:hypothetical protein
MRNSQYGGGPIAFYRLLADWRAEGTVPGLEVTHAAAEERKPRAPELRRRLPVISSDVPA